MLTGIMNPRDWPSPTAAGYMASTSAWLWTAAFFQQDGFQNSGIKIDSAWCSTFLPLRHLVRTENYTYIRLVLHVGSHSVVCCRMQQTGDREWAMLLQDGSIHVRAFRDRHPQIHSPALRGEVFTWCGCRVGTNRSRRTSTAIWPHSRNYEPHQRAPELRNAFLRGRG